MVVKGIVDVHQVEKDLIVPQKLILKTICENGLDATNTAKKIKVSLNFFDLSPDQCLIFSIKKQVLTNM